MNNNKIIIICGTEIETVMDDDEICRTKTARIHDYLSSMIPFKFRACSTMKNVIAIMLIGGVEWAKCDAGIDRSDPHVSR